MNDLAGEIVAALHRHGWQFRISQDGTRHRCDLIPPEGSVGLVTASASGRTRCQALARCFSLAHAGVPLTKVTA